MISLCLFNHKTLLRSYSFSISPCMSWSSRLYLSFCSIISSSLIIDRNGSGNKTYTLVINIIIHRLSKEASLMSTVKTKCLRRKYINIPPIYRASSWPKLMVDINKAYIVPSIFSGQILQARTRIGSMFSSATSCISKVSLSEKASSGIPNLTFSLNRLENCVLPCHLQNL